MLVLGFLKAKALLGPIIFLLDLMEFECRFGDPFASFLMGLRQ